jgi:hypothetical protein
LKNLDWLAIIKRSIAGILFLISVPFIAIGFVIMFMFSGVAYGGYLFQMFTEWLSGKPKRRKGMDS